MPRSPEIQHRAAEGQVPLDAFATDDASAADDTSSEAGAGLIGLMGGVLVFLIFLLFAVQLLIGLYGRSVVTGMAYDGARDVASYQNRSGPAITLDAAHRLAEQRMRREVGNMNLQFSWAGSTDDTVVLRVQADNPRFLWPGLSRDLGSDHIDRTVHARMEKLQDEAAP
jgi:hypothetical protein